MNMSVFTYRCPGTGMLVQGWAAATVSQDSADSTYTSTQCPACARIHLIDQATGMVLDPAGMMREGRQSCANGLPYDRKQGDCDDGRA